MRKIKDFSKSELKEISMLYVSSGESYSTICARYEISTGTFYRILRKTMIEHIVDYNVIAKFKEVSENNELFFFGKKNKARTKNNYYNILIARNNYLLSNCKSKRIFKLFLYNISNMRENEFCDKYYMDPELLAKTILKCIVNNIVSNKDYNKFKEEVLKKKVNYNEIFDELDILREKDQEFNIIDLYNFIMDSDGNINAQEFIEDLS